jgi:hypothetical protein
MHDIRHAVRAPIATPVVSTVAVLPLAMGIGANVGDDTPEPHGDICLEDKRPPALRTRALTFPRIGLIFLGRDRLRVARTYRD